MKTTRARIAAKLTVLTLLVVSATQVANGQEVQGYSDRQSPFGRYVPFEPEVNSPQEVASLGVWVTEQRTMGGYRQGLKIEKVTRNSLAAHWGFERGDILYRVGGYKTRSTYDLQTAMQRSGTFLSVEYRNVRNGRYERSEVQKQFRNPEPSPDVPFPSVPEEENTLAVRLGMQVTEMRNHHLVVDSVGHGLAWQMGLKRGDVITDMASVGIPLTPGAPAQAGAILRQLKVYRPGAGSFEVDLKRFGDIIF